MKIIKEDKIILTWDFKDMGLFEATIINGEIIDVRFCKKGSNVDGECLWASKGSEIFLERVYEALKELLGYAGVIHQG